MRGANVVCVFLFLVFSIHHCAAQPRNAPCRVLPPDSGVYFGAFPDLGDSEDKVSAKALDNFKKLVKKMPVWVYYSQNWWDGIQFPSRSVEIIQDQGAIPFIRLMSRSNGSANQAEPKYSLKAIASGDFDDELSAWASEAKEVDGPLMVEFGPEANDCWWSWNGKWNGGAAGPELFRRAYRHIVALFREQGAHNITWCYHASAFSDPNPKDPENAWNTMAAYYPGDDVVDWIGLTIYGAHYAPPKENCVSFKQQFDPAYQELRQISPHKPLAIFEFSTAEDCAPVTKTEWFQEFFTLMEKGEYPLIKGACVWHSKFQEDGATINMRIDSNKSTLALFRKGIAGPTFAAKAKIAWQ